MDSNCIFYVYVYLNPLKPGRYYYKGLNISFLYEPFYVGKGKHSRMFGHIAEAKSRKSSAKHLEILKIIENEIDPKDYIIKIACNMEEDAAFELEKAVIKIIGRKCINKSNPLFNLAYGGKWYNNHLSKFSYEEKLEIVEKYANGKTTTQLGNTYSCDHKTICKILKEVGTGARPVNTEEKYSKDFINAVVQSYSNGLSMKNVGILHNIDRATVARFLQILSVPARASGFQLGHS